MFDRELKESSSVLALENEHKTSEMVKMNIMCSEEKKIVAVREQKLLLPPKRNPTKLCTSMFCAIIYPNQFDFALQEVSIILSLYFSELQHAEFKEAFNEFDKVSQTDQFYKADEGTL